MIVLTVIGGIVFLYVGRRLVHNAILTVWIAPSAIEVRGRQALYRAIVGFIVFLGMASLLCWLAILVLKPGVFIPYEWILVPWIIWTCAYRALAWMTRWPEARILHRLRSWEILILLVIFIVLAQVKGYYLR